MKTNTPLSALRYHVTGAIERGEAQAIVGVVKGAGRIIPTQHEKDEWSRMAQDAYSRDLNDIGHKFSMAATLKRGEDCALAWFDALQNEYRAWLIGGFKKEEVL